MFDKPIYQFTFWDCMKLCWLFIILGWISGFISDFASLGIDNTDKDGWHRSGVSIVHDYGTGVDYLKTPEGYITPRLGVAK